MQIFEHTLMLHYVHKVKQSLYRPVTSPEGFRSSRLSECETIGKWWRWGCQPTHLSPLPPREFPWYSFLLEAE